MKFLKQLFTWWHSQTVGTMIYTWRKGVLIGSDDNGNLFYESKKTNRRWVIFNNYVEASSVSSDWHGWLHHTVAKAPNNERKDRKIWEKPHLENRTGSNLAYHPLGKNRIGSNNFCDYEAWSPENEE